MTNESQKCKSCHATGTGKYCPHCGQSYAAKRITIGGLFHEIFHYFTHLDKGFLYTLKRLVVAPGTMQKEYIEGVRGKHQKPFSMFFLCCTFAALALYWINLSIAKYYDAGDTKEVAFFHHYWVLLQVCLLPLYSMIVYLIFIKSKMNYAEIVIFQLYLFSFIVILLTIIHLFKFISPHAETRYVELPALGLYSIITNYNFFNSKSKLILILKSILAVALSFFLATYIQDFLVDRYM